MFILIYLKCSNCLRIDNYIWYFKLSISNNSDRIKFWYRPNYSYALIWRYYLTHFKRISQLSCIWNIKYISLIWISRPNEFILLNRHTSKPSNSGIKLFINSIICFNHSKQWIHCWICYCCKYLRSRHRNNWIKISWHKECINLSIN